MRELNIAEIPHTKETGQVKAVITAISTTLTAQRNILKTKVRSIMLYRNIYLISSYFLPDIGLCQARLGDSQHSYTGQCGYRKNTGEADLTAVHSPCLHSESYALILRTTSSMKHRDSMLSTTRLSKMRISGFAWIRPWKNGDQIQRQKSR